jgi:antitoxin component HigA of HigAB toxin-antitoxin module
MKQKHLVAIQNETAYEKALVLLRTLRGSEPGSEAARQREELKASVLAYERVHHPFGEDNFEDWARELQKPGVAEAKIAAIDQAERGAATLTQWAAFIQKRKALIQKRIKEKGTSQQELAQKFNVKKAHLSNILSGKRTLNTNVVVLLSHYLEIPVEKLLPPVELAREAILTE